jgi:hypothetical protein
MTPAARYTWQEFVQMMLAVDRRRASFKRSSDCLSPDGSLKDPIGNEAQLAKAIGQLKSLHDGDAGLLDVLSCGRKAVPALRQILMTREPSGLYETRRRAVEALAQFRAFDVLEEYLETPRNISDPVELTGEEAVTNAAARALPRAQDPSVVDVLLRLTEHNPLSGVVDALGELGCVAAAPYFMRALGEDFTRPAAEAALRKLGASVRQVLLDGAIGRADRGTCEPESSRRLRRSALRLYAELAPIPREDWPSIRRLTADADPEVAVTACKLCLGGSHEPATVDVARRLVELLGEGNWMLDEEIEACLVDHFDAAGAVVEDATRAIEQSGELDGPRARRARVLRRTMLCGAEGTRARTDMTIRDKPSEE